MTLLYTYGQTISLTIAGYNQYTAIRYSPTDATTPVDLVLTDGGYMDF